MSDDEIGLLASMMDEPDDSVRSWMALSLGILGPRARMAVPQLERAFKRVACVRGSGTSKGAIELTLAKIGVAPPEVVCEREDFGPTIRLGRPW